MTTKVEAEDGPNVSRMLDSMLQDYDKRVRPDYGGPGVTVGISLYVLSMSEVSETNMVRQPPSVLD